MTIEQQIALGGAIALLLLFAYGLWKLGEWVEKGEK